MKVRIKNHQRLIRININRVKKESLLLLKSFSIHKAELGILLVNDRRMKKLNRLYRGIDRTTDVLSFPIFTGIKEIPDDRDALLGDIVINLHAAKRQALIYSVSLNNEVRRLLVHGFLHLLGYDHEKNVYHSQKMTKMEKQLQNDLETLD